MYQYQNDPLFKMKIDGSATFNLDSFMVQLIQDPRRAREYLVQYNLRKHKIENMIRNKEVREGTV
jgi:hypothetical protein